MAWLIAARDINTERTGRHAEKVQYAGLFVPGAPGADSSICVFCVHWAAFWQAHRRVLWWPLVAM